MNRNALAHIRGGQKFPAFVDLEFRPEVIKASGASNLQLNAKSEALQI